MIKLDKMTDAEIWAEIEDCFYTISMDVEHRSYSERSTNGARHLQHLVRKNLIWIDRALLEIEMRSRHTDDGAESIPDGEHLPPARQAVTPVSSIIA